MYVRFKDDQYQFQLEDPSEEELRKFYQDVFHIALSKIHQYLEIPEKSRKKVDKLMKKAKEDTLEYLKDKKLPKANQKEKPKFLVFIINLPEKKVVKKVSLDAEPEEKAYFYALIADLLGKELGLEPFWITREEHLVKKFPHLKPKGLGRYKRYGKK
ncbi:MAG: hypothetical protein GXN92_01345 [Candidatus Micrarchaeota archaeon]|nr:hypothetical protein [Candidatus Micrarchaeota archaeon]